MNELRVTCANGKSAIRWVPKLRECWLRLSSESAAKVILLARLLVVVFRLSRPYGVRWRTLHYLTVALMAQGALSSLQLTILFFLLAAPPEQLSFGSGGAFIFERNFVPFTSKWTLRNCPLRNFLTSGPESRQMLRRTWRIITLPVYKRPCRTTFIADGGMACKPAATCSGTDCARLGLRALTSTRLYEMIHAGFELSFCTKFDVK